MFCRLPEGHRLAPAGNFDVMILIEEHVLQFQTSVGDAHLVHLLDAFRYLNRPSTSLCRANVFLVKDTQVERLACRLVHDRVDRMVHLREDKESVRNLDPFWMFLSLELVTNLEHIIESNERVAFDLFIIGPAHVSFNLQTIGQQIGFVSSGALVQPGHLDQHPFVALFPGQKLAAIILHDQLPDSVSSRLDVFQ